MCFEVVYECILLFGFSVRLKGASFAVYISFLGFKSADDFVKMIELDLDVVHVKRFLYPTVVMNSLCEV